MKKKRKVCHGTYSWVFRNFTERVGVKNTQRNKDLQQRMLFSKIHIQHVAINPQSVIFGRQFSKDSADI